MSATRSERAGSAALVVGLHLAAAWLLWNASGARAPRRPEEALQVFDAVPPAPPPPEERPLPSRAAPEREGEAAPPALRADPKPIVAPPSVVPLPPPLLAAPVAGQADQAAAGAAPTPGPGTGAGGVGDGLGAGGSGDGTGGGGDGLASRSRHVKGRIRHADYPDAARRARRGGTVLARIDIDARGRVQRCTVTDSSGDADLDQTTCRLIAARFRYDPARDRAGRPAPDTRHWRQVWWLEGDGPRP